MHVVAIHGWQSIDDELARKLGEVLGLGPFESRQRLTASNPAVAACLTDAARSQSLVERLEQSGFATVAVDTGVLRSTAAARPVVRFAFTDQELQLVLSDGDSISLPFERVRLLLVGTGIIISGESTTVTERKFSLGKTLLAGGLPMTKKVTRSESTLNEQRDEILYLYADQGPAFAFHQQRLAYDGLGAAIELTRELNFSRLKYELRQRCPEACFDDRLRQRATQARLLGSLLQPESDLDVAFAILAGSLRRAQ